jgi:hypothetical protein
MQLGSIAHARSGDKGNISQISLIAFEAKDFPLIEREVTPQAVRQHLRLPPNVQIERYVVPGLNALNFVLSGALAGGVTRSIRLDAHGKTLAMQMLDFDMSNAPHGNAA